MSVNSDRRCPELKYDEKIRTKIKVWIKDNALEKRKLVSIERWRHLMQQRLWWSIETTLQSTSNDRSRGFLLTDSMRRTLMLNMIWAKTTFPQAFFLFLNNTNKKKCKFFCKLWNSFWVNCVITNKNLIEFRRTISVRFVSRWSWSPYSIDFWCFR